MFDRAGIDISITRSAIEPTTRALASVRKAGIPVVYLKHGHRPDLSDLGAPDSPHRIKHLPMAVGTTVTAPDGRASRVLIRDTWNTDILDEVKPETGDTIYKTRYKMLRNRSRLCSQSARHQVVDRHRSYDVRLRGLDRTRCDVQGLSLHPPRGLYWGADWTRVFEKQS